MERKKTEREKGERKVLKNEKGRDENKEEKQKAQEFQMRSLRCNQLLQTIKEDVWSLSASSFYPKQT